MSAAEDHQAARDAKLASLHERLIHAPGQHVFVGSWKHALDDPVSETSQPIGRTPPPQATDGPCQ